MQIRISAISHHQPISVQPKKYRVSLLCLAKFIVFQMSDEKRRYVVVIRLEFGVYMTSVLVARVSLIITAAFAARTLSDNRVYVFLDLVITFWL